MKVDMSTPHSLRMTLDELYRKWPSMSVDERTAFKEERMNQVLQCTDNRGTIECFTSGSSRGRPSRYLYGPFFNVHFKFYNDIFYGPNRRIVHLRLSSTGAKNYSGELIDAVHLNVVNNGKVRWASSQIDNVSIVVNPGVLYIMIKKFGIGFINEVFNTKTCVLHCTYEVLRQDHVDVFNECGFHDVREHMRNWRGGSTFYTCRYSNKHMVDFASDMHSTDPMICSDLWNSSQRHIYFDSGDRINHSRSTHRCECGYEIDNIVFEPVARTIEVAGCIVRYDLVSSLIEKEYGSECVVRIGYDNSRIELYVYGGNASQKSIDDIDGIKSILINLKKSGVSVETIRSPEIPPHDRKITRMFEINGCEKFEAL